MTVSRSDFINRIRHYCAEAEKSTHDILSKLESWGVPSEEIDDIIEKLRSEKFLDDARYAKSYVSEKWNMDKWGRIKIQNNLKQKNIPEYIVEEALATIDEDEYLKGLHELLRKKFTVAAGENSPASYSIWRDLASLDLQRRSFRDDEVKKVVMFTLSRGFEEELIVEWLDKNGFDI